MTGLLHASCAARAGCGVLIIGASGAGKSTLLMQLMAYGADLVADDGVVLELQGEILIARPGPNIAGMVEARGVGMLAAPNVPSCRLKLVVDMDQSEPERLPPRRYHHAFGTQLELVLGKGNVALAPAIWLLLQGVRVA
ncbi:MAG: serine kinase [Paracoccaceae bacterium]